MSMLIDRVAIVTGRRALPAGRIVALGATMDLRYGLPGTSR